VKDATARDYALVYSARGWPVLPCHEPTLNGCSCGRSDCASPAKHPRLRRGLHDATLDPALIRRWWERWPDAGVAVRTGSISGLVVVDIDRHSGGFRSLARLQRHHGRLPHTPVTFTGGGGRHYWFAHPGHPVPNSTGRLGPGIDIRGDGGYVLAPPTKHMTGRRYDWGAEPPLAALPAWVLERTREPVSPPLPSRQRSAAAGPWAGAALTAEVRRVRTATLGNRNHTLNRSAFSLGQLVGAGYLDDDTVREELTAAALQVGLRPREIRATVSSGLRAGSRLPRHPRALEPELQNAPPP
jgi:hypothetical protein